MVDLVKGKMVIQDEGNAHPISYVKQHTPVPSKWQPPPPNWTKLNVDGSFSIEDGSVGARMILRDHEGAIIFSTCHSIWPCPDMLYAELAGCMEGLALVHQ